MLHSKQILAAFASSGSAFVRRHLPPTPIIHTFTLVKSALAILLAIFVTWSALQPCQDGHVPEEIREACPMVAVANSTSHHCCAAETPPKEDSNGCGEEPGTDGCSTFCSCQCCGTVFLQIIPEHRAVEWSPIARAELAYLPETGREFPQLIWQPPPFSLDA